MFCESPAKTSVPSFSISTPKEEENAVNHCLNEMLGGSNNRNDNHESRTSDFPKIIGRSLIQFIHKHRKEIHHEFHTGESLGALKLVDELLEFWAEPEKVSYNGSAKGDANSFSGFTEEGRASLGGSTFTAHAIVDIISKTPTGRNVEMVVGDLLGGIGEKILHY
jgi:hypothetical protein